MAGKIEFAPRAAVIRLDGWAGRMDEPCLVVGQTSLRYRIRAVKRIPLAGRDRWLDADKETLVPKHAVKFTEEKT